MNTRSKQVLIGQQYYNISHLNHFFEFISKINRNFILDIQLLKKTLQTYQYLKNQIYSIE